MKYRAIIKQSEGWWIGWLVDLPGVNAQERTKRKLLESLQIGAQDMLATQVPFEPETSMTLIDVPDAVWHGEQRMVSQPA
jgi:predicted RNase H-like HicB family nuclease